MSSEDYRVMYLRLAIAETHGQCAIAGDPASSLSMYHNARTYCRRALEGPTVSGLALQQCLFLALEPSADSGVVAAEMLGDLAEPVAVVAVGGGDGASMVGEELAEWWPYRLDLDARDLGQGRAQAECLSQELVGAQPFAPDLLLERFVESRVDEGSVSALRHLPPPTEVSEQEVGAHERLGGPGAGAGVVAAPAPLAGVRAEARARTGLSTM